MGKTKSKVVREESETHKLSERQTNVNTLIQRLNSRTEPLPSDSVPSLPCLIITEPGDTHTDSDHGTTSEATVHTNNNPCSAGGDDENMVIHQHPVHNTFLQCSKLNPDQHFVEPEKHVNVVVKKSDSIDYIIDLIVNKSAKREEQLLLEKSRKVKRSQSYNGKEKKENKKKYMKVRSCEDGQDEWEGTLLQRLDSLQERAQIFEKRVDCIHSWLRRETDFDRNMRNVLEETREQQQVEMRYC